MKTPGQILADELREQAKELLEKHGLEDHAVRCAKAVSAIEELMDQNSKLRLQLRICEMQMAKIGGIYFDDVIRDVRRVLAKDSGL